MVVGLAFCCKLLLSQEEPAAQTLEDYKRFNSQKKRNLLLPSQGGATDDRLRDHKNQALFADQRDILYNAPYLGPPTTVLTEPQVMDLNDPRANPFSKATA